MSSAPADDTFRRYSAALERDFRTGHHVSEYAAALLGWTARAPSPARDLAATGTTAGRSTSDARVLLEAERLPRPHRRDGAADISRTSASPNRPTSRSSSASGTAVHRWSSRRWLAADMSRGGFQPDETAVRRDVFRRKVWSAQRSGSVEDTPEALVLGCGPGAELSVPTTWIEWLRIGRCVRPPTRPAEPGRGQLAARPVDLARHGPSPMGAARTPGSASTPSTTSTAAIA
ncbi:hypothetical protein ACRAWF_20005 [Streptomyces sp. L7]